MEWGATNLPAVPAEDVRVQRREPGVTDDPNLEHRSWPTEEGHTLGPN